MSVQVPFVQNYNQNFIEVKALYKKLPLFSNDLISSQKINANKYLKQIVGWC